MSEENKEQKPDTTPGIVCWNELSSRDAAGSETFYSGLFGWKAEDMGMTDHPYKIFKVEDGRGAAGVMQMPPEAGEAPTSWVAYVNVENIETSTAKAAELGATVLRPATDLPFGKFSIIMDPQGAVIGLWEPKDVEC